MGICDLRIGHNEKLYYGGNIGYAVSEKYRGHHYAGKACLLLFELARKHKLGHVIITCDPDNNASRKTCEYAGGKLLEIAELPEDNDMRIERRVYTGLNCRAKQLAVTDCYLLLKKIVKRWTALWSLLKNTPT